MKAQVGVDFYFSVGIVIFLLIIFYPLFLMQKDKTEFESGFLEAKRICLKISNAINSALIAGDGFVQNFSIPLFINGKNYSINVTPSRVKITWNNGFSSCRIPTEIWNNSLNTFSLKKGDITISNEGGKIFVD